MNGKSQISLICAAFVQFDAYFKVFKGNLIENCPLAGQLIVVSSLTLV
ncbi:hypothetical protein QWZ13_00390 [Reinekea marina]|nr:hypothetical protein [Reinekea marina]MDN3647360.1 hypothetical protein [Reinekea marina]